MVKRDKNIYCRYFKFASTDNCKLKNMHIINPQRACARGLQ